MAILSKGGSDNSRRRDSIILAFQDAKISVLEFDDSLHGLRITYVSNVLFLSGSFIVVKLFVKIM